MTTHLSARLAWHDRGWDGRIRDAPHLNAHCIVHQHIRDARDDEWERSSAGTALSELDGWLPPCSRDPAAYAERGFVIVHRDPLEFRRLPSVSEDLPPYSSMTATATSSETCYAVDRDNRRVQVFDADGTFLDEWTDLTGVQALYVAGDRIWAGGALRELDSTIVAELPDGGGGHGMTVGRDGAVFVAQIGQGRVQRFVADAAE